MSGPAEGGRGGRLRLLAFAFASLFGAGLGSGCAGGRSGLEHTPADPNPTVQGEQSSPQAATPTGPDGRGVVRLLPPGKEPLTVASEVVYTPAGRQRGLMYRESLDPDAGMLFLFEREAQLSFWMRNTYIPLDMIFIRSDLTVLGVVENAEPLTETSRRVAGLSQYVLEVNAGYCREHGIGEGTRVELEGVDDELDAMP